MNRPVTLSNLLVPQGILTGLEVTDKKQLLQTMASHAATALSLEEHMLMDVLWEREKLGTTGVGHGIAIPHARVAGLGEVRGFFARLSTPVAFEAIDNDPVDLVFLLLAPEAAGADHLHALAAVSRALRDPKLCEDLRGAKDVAMMARLLSKVPAAEAA